jgi:hypothetical protein
MGHTVGVLVLNMRWSNILEGGWLEDRVLRLSRPHLLLLLLGLPLKIVLEKKLLEGHPFVVLLLRLLEIKRVYTSRMLLAKG